MDLNPIVTVYRTVSHSVHKNLGQCSTLNDLKMAAFLKGEAIRFEMLNNLFNSIQNTSF